jgi:5-methylcytosine-specific restriction endonuclease McrA
LLHRERSARFALSGFWPFQRYRFQAGDIEASASLSRSAYRRLQRHQTDDPVLVLHDEATGRRWWLFRDEVLWEDQGLGRRQVKALALERLLQRERRLQRALALLEPQAEPDGGRAAAPDSVKACVWKRDGGRCVRCGGRDRLEFDHVIPLSRGGATTARNLQLLCESCNRRKGASISHPAGSST